MCCGHPQQTQIIGRVPIIFGPTTTGFTGEVLAPGCPKGAAARATLALLVRRHDLDAHTGDIDLVPDEPPKLIEPPARVVPANRLRNIRPAAYECQPRGLAIEAKGPFVVLHGPVPIVVDAAARGLCRLAIRSDAGDGPYGEVGSEPEALAARPVTRRLQLLLAGHGLRGFACDVPTGLNKRFNRRRHLGTVRVTAIELAADGQHLHGLHALLDLNGALDNGRRCSAHIRNEVTVGPKRRKTGFKPPKHAELRIDVDHRVDVVRHDPDLNQDVIRFLDFGNNLLDPPIDAIDQLGADTSDKRPRRTWTRRRCFDSICTPSRSISQRYNPQGGRAFLPMA